MCYRDLFSFLFWGCQLLSFLLGQWLVFDCPGGPFFVSVTQGTNLIIKMLDDAEDIPLFIKVNSHSFQAIKDAEMLVLKNFLTFLLLLLLRKLHLLICNIAFLFIFNYFRKIVCVLFMTRKRVQYVAVTLLSLMCLFIHTWYIYIYIYKHSRGDVSNKVVLLKFFILTCY